MKTIIIMAFLFMAGCYDAPYMEIGVDEDAYNIIASSEIPENYMDALKFITHKYDISAILVKKSTDTLSVPATYYMFVSSTPFKIIYDKEN